MRNHYLSGVLLVCFLRLIPALAWADGMSFYGRDISMALKPLQEKEQVAAIVHRAGTEKLIIAMNFEADDKDNALWILPVPGTPDRTKVDVVDFFPRFFGRNPRSEAAKPLDHLMLLARLTQLYPIVFDMPNMMKGRPMPERSKYVEKWGIHVEVVTANSAEVFHAYLRKKKVALSLEQVSTFAPYFSERYVLIVAWIASRERFLEEFPAYRDEFSRLGRDRWPCLYMEFPTERAFYPLRPTSAYGDADVPLRLYVMGYVEPQVKPPLAGSIETSYYLQRSLGENVPKQFTEGLPAENIPYTKVEVRGPARSFTQDLWFSAEEPESIRYARKLQALSESPVFPVVVLFVAIPVLSYLAAGLTGLWFFQEWKKYARMGLWNALTIIAVYVVVCGWWRGKGAKLESKRGRFLVLFSLLYVFLTVVVQLGIEWPLGREALGELPVAVVYLALVLGVWFVVGLLVRRPRRA